MGCSTSKLEDEEAIQLCKDRKRFIKQAVEQRARFASGHIAYIHSLRRVSAALRDYIEGDEPRVFLLDSYITPSFMPVKKTSPGFIPISSKSFSATPIQSEPNSSLKVNYLRSGGNPAIVVEERPQSPETGRVETFSATPIQSEPNSSLKVNYIRSGGNPAIAVEERPQSPETGRVETYSPMHHMGIDGFFAMQSSPMHSSFFSYTPNNRPNLPPPSPQTSQWDFFWNPFSTLDYYGYPNHSSLDQPAMDDEIMGIRQVREEEGIPDLEEETEQEETVRKINISEERDDIDVNFVREEVIVEDADDEDDEDEDEDEDDADSGIEVEHEVKGLRSHGSGSIRLSEVEGQVEIGNQETAVSDKKSKEETPGFTVYVNRRPTSMAEVIKDLEEQFMIVCNSANEVSALLEATRAQYPSASNELSAMKMLNPVALIRSASSRSSSARFLMNSSSSRDEGYESSSDVSEESCMFSGSHQSTLDRLYAWEKKLYDEVKSGERVRIAYERKCNQLRNQDVKGDDPSSVDKTRAVIRDLHTQIKVSIHSVEAISKRIEALRDEELQPQLLELVQGLARMWKVMAECHQIQKRTLDEAKLLLAGTPSKIAEAKKQGAVSTTTTETHRLARSAANLEAELRNWKACFESWITSQRSYMHALAGWLLRCIRSDPGSPHRTSGAPPIFGICTQWSRFLDEIHELPVLEGLDFFAAGVGSLYAQQLREDSRRAPGGSKRFGGGSGGNLEVVEFGGVVEEDVMTAEKMAEVAIRVLCAGMSVAMSSLTEFAIGSADGYANLVKQWDNTKWPRDSGEAGV